MRLIDFMEGFDENDELKVHSWDGKEICRYDGKNAIDERYNDCKVLCVVMDTTGADVYINDMEVL